MHSSNNHRELLMRRSQSARYFVLASWSMMAVLGTAGCGSERTNGLMSHQAEALNQNDFIESQNSRFFWRVEWLSGEPLATQKASARLLFNNAEGKAARTLGIQDLKVIMTCCRESGAVPQVENEAGANPAQRDVGNILASKSGTWELEVQAIVDGAEVDTATWKFDVGVP
jgi:hypothetical protein